MNEYWKKAKERMAMAAKTSQNSLKKLKESPQLNEFVKKAMTEKEKLEERLKKEKQQINERYSNYGKREGESSSKGSGKESENSIFDKWSSFRDRNLSDKIENSARKARVWISLLSRGAKDSKLGDKIKEASSNILEKAQEMDIGSKVKNLKEKASEVIPNKETISESADNIREKSKNLASNILRGTRKTGRSFAFYFMAGIFLYALGSNIPHAYVNYRNYKYQNEMLEEKIRSLSAQLGAESRRPNQN